MKISKIIAFAAMGAVVSSALTACNDDDDNNIDLGKYQEWRAENDQWLAELQSKTNEDGTPYYETVVPAWNPGGFILMHFFNDRSETAGNLVPLYTSVVDVIYEGYDLNGDMFDSSKSTNIYGRTGVQRFACNNTIQGWSIAMENMHVGDTCEIVVPYQVAYGSSVTGSLMPYSTLRFNLRLYDIYKYEGSPY